VASEEVEAAHQKHRADLRIGEAGADALFHAARGGVCRYDGRQGSVVAVVQQLEELLVRPRRAALRTEVVEDEEMDVLDALEQLVEGLWIVRAESDT
jgi:hypothetical protein